MSLWADNELVTRTKINQKELFVGAAAPSEIYDGQLWYDTTNLVHKGRRSGAWVSFAYVDVAQTFSASQTFSADASFGGNITLSNGAGKIRFSAGDSFLWEESSGVLAIRNIANNAYKDLKLNTLNAAGQVDLSSRFTFYTNGDLKSTSSWLLHYATASTFTVYSGSPGSGVQKFQVADSLITASVDVSIGANKLKTTDYDIFQESDRLRLQRSTANQSTLLFIMPNGTSETSDVRILADSSTSAYAALRVYSDASNFYINSMHVGDAVKPLKFQMNGNDIDTINTDLTRNFHSRAVSNFKLGNAADGNAQNFNNLGDVALGVGTGTTFGIRARQTGAFQISTYNNSASDTLRMSIASNLASGSGNITFYERLIVGTFPNSLTNSGEAWFGRAVDRPAGTATIQLGTNNSSYFEVVDYNWSEILFKVSDSDIAYVAKGIKSDGIIEANAQVAIAYMGDIDEAQWLTKLGGYDLTFSSDNADATTLGTGDASYGGRTFRPKFAISKEGVLRVSGGIALANSKKLYNATNSSFNMQWNSDNDLIFDKPRDATNARKYSVNDVGGLSGDANGGSFWRGFHFNAPSITVAAVSYFPRLSIHAQYSTLTDPSLRTWIIEAGNDNTANVQHDIAIYTSAGQVARFAGVTYPDASISGRLFVKARSGWGSAGTMAGFDGIAIGDDDTGLGFAADGIIRFHANGVIVGRWNSSGVLFGSDTNPTRAFTVHAAATSLASFEKTSGEALTISVPSANLQQITSTLWNGSTAQTLRFAVWSGSSAVDMMDLSSNGNYVAVNANFRGWGDGTKDLGTSSFYWAALYVLNMRSKYAGAERTWLFDGEGAGNAGTKGFGGRPSDNAVFMYDWGNSRGVWFYYPASNLFEVVSANFKFNGTPVMTAKEMIAVCTAAGAVVPAASAPTKTLVDGTNHDYYVLDYADGSTTEAFWDFKLPPTIGTNLNISIKIAWISTVNTGAVVWGGAVLGRVSGEAFDAALGSETTATTTTAGTAGQVNETTITINTSGLDNNDLVVLRVRRIGGDAADTMAAAARLISATLSVV